MKVNLAQIATLTLATITTSISAAIAITGAYSRANGDSERLVLASVACVAAIAVHVLLATSRRTPKPLTWLLWTACFLFALYGHCAYFVATWEQAAETNFAQGRLARSIQEEKEAIKQELSKIQTRPVTTIARLMARTNSEEQVMALRIEMREAERSIELQKQLRRLIETTSNTVATDPFTARVIAITGWSPGAVTVASSIFMAVVLELLGAYFWLEARGARVITTEITHRDLASERSNDDYQQCTPVDSDKLTRLREALASGACGTGVVDVRKFLRCGQERALLLHRQLVEQGTIHKESRRPRKTKLRGTHSPNRPSDSGAS